MFTLRRFLKETLSLEQCKEIVKKRLEERDENFIEIVKRNIYENEKSPYLKLLNLAGCEFGDFRSCVLREGIEKTLEKLRESGVYLAYDEFKGRVDNRGYIVSFWCGENACLEKVKADTKYTSRCIYEDKEHKCLCCGKDSKYKVYFAIAY